MFDRAIMDTYELPVIPSLAILAVGIILQYLIARYLAARKDVAKPASLVPSPAPYLPPRPAET